MARIYGEQQTGDPASPDLSRRRSRDLSRQASPVKAAETGNSSNRALPTPRLLVAIFAVSVLQCLPSQFQSAMVNQPYPLLVEFTNASFHAHYGYYPDSHSLKLLWGALLGGGQGVAGVICTLFLHSLGKRIGLRRALFIFGSLLNVIGSACCAVGYWINSFELFFVGQTVGVGFAFALVYTLGPVYLTECSPPHQRGVVGVYIAGLGSYLGILVAYVLGLNQVLGSERLLGYYMIIPGILAFIGFFFMLVLEDSPKEVYILQKNKEKAEAIMKTFYGSDCKTKEIFKQFEEEQLQTSEHFRVWELFTQYHLRKALTVACFASIFYFSSGIAITTVFSTACFEQLGIPSNIAQLATIAIALPLPFLSHPSSVVIEKCGRRPPLLFGGLLMTILLVAYVAFGVASLKTNILVLGYVAGACIILNGWVSPFGPPTVGLFLATEVFPQKARTAGTAVTMLVNYVAWSVSAGLFPLLLEANGPWAAIVLLVVPNIFILAYLWRNAPETAGRSCNDVVNVWFKKDEIRTIA